LFCDRSGFCSANQLTLDFSAPVRRAEIARTVRLDDRAVDIVGNADVAKAWTFRVAMHPRAKYAVVVDSTIRDAFGRRLEGPTSIAANTEDDAPQLMYAKGTITVASSGARTMPLRSTNVRSVRVISYRIPDSMRVATMNSVVGAFDASGRWLRGLTPETT